MIRALLRWFRCSHPSIYRERRDVGKAKAVMHLVCPDCHYAAPLITRSTVEHLRAVRDGRVKRLKAARPQGVVVSMKREAR
jgi:hypothetical protein